MFLNPITGSHSCKPAFITSRETATSTTKAAAYTENSKFVSNFCFVVIADLKYACFW